MYICQLEGSRGYLYKFNILKKSSPLECVRCLPLSSPMPARVPKMLKKCLLNTSTNETHLECYRTHGKNNNIV